MAEEVKKEEPKKVGPLGKLKELSRGQRGADGNLLHFCALGYLNLEWWNIDIELCFNS